MVLAEELELEADDDAELLGKESVEEMLEDVDEADAESC